MRLTSMNVSDVVADNKLPNKIIRIVVSMVAGPLPTCTTDIELANSAQIINAATAECSADHLIILVMEQGLTTPVRP